MKFSVFTVSCPSLTPDDAIRTLSDLGYDGVEWRVTHDPAGEGAPAFWSNNRCTLQPDWDDGQFARIAEQTRDAGLGIPNLGTYVKADDLPAVTRSIEIAAAMGVSAIRVGSGELDVGDYAGSLERARHQLGQAIEIAAPHGVKLLIEMHHGAFTPSASAALRLVETFSPEDVGVIHDCGNMVFEGFERYPLGLSTLGQYLAHVHVKNGVLRESITREGAALYAYSNEAAPLRRGMVDFTALFEALKAVGYDGWISVEDFSTSTPEPERLRDNLAFLHDIHARVNGDRTSAGPGGPEDAENPGNPVFEAGKLADAPLENPIRCGVIGLGRIGWGHHVKAIREHNGFELVAACDTLESRREEAASELGSGCAVYDDLAPFLADDRLEMVMVCTPSMLHEPMSIAALRAGKHVLCEKPAALSPEGLREVIDASRAAKKTLTFHHNYRLNPEFLCMKEIVDSGALGHVFRIHRNAGSFARRNDWQTLGKYGGGMAGNWGVHLVDQGLQFMSPTIAFAWGSVNHIINPGDVEDDIKAVIQDSEGVVLDINMTAADASGRPSWVINGTCGTAWISDGALHIKHFNPGALNALEPADQPFANDRKYGITGYDNAYADIPWRHEVRRVKPEGDYDSYYDNLYKAVRENGDLLVSPESALRTYEALGAILSDGIRDLTGKPR